MLESNVALLVMKCKDDFEKTSEMEHEKKNRIKKIMIDIIITLFGEEGTSALAGFHAGLLFWSNWDFGEVDFCGGRKTGVPGEKNHRCKARTNNKLNPQMLPNYSVPSEIFVFTIIACTRTLFP